MQKVFSNSQMGAFRSRHAEQQLRKAAQDLHARAHEDYSFDQIHEALKGVADRATPLGIKRMKWLKILTLWHLYPTAAPAPEVLEEVLRSEGHQDDRMDRAIKLPLAGKSEDDA